MDIFVGKSNADFMGQYRTYALESIGNDHIYRITSKQDVYAILDKVLHAHLPAWTLGNLFDHINHQRWISAWDVVLRL